MTDQDSQKAAREAAAAFIQSASPVPTPAADKTPAQAAAEAKEAYRDEDETSGGGHRVAIVIGLIIALLVLAGAGAYLFFSGTFSSLTGSLTPVEEVQRAPLSDERVIAAFDEATVETPDISHYAYVSQDALIGPKFSNIIVNEPVDLGVSGNQVVECTATATAIFKNKGIEIDVPVTLPFEYSVEGETWVPGELTQGEPTTTPLASASPTEIVGNLNDILAAYDPTYAEDMLDAVIVKTTADLTIDGGPITVDLSKSVKEEQEDKTIDELRTCTVELAVVWSNDSGWDVTVASASEIDRKKSVVDYLNNSAESQPVDTSPQNLGNLNFGDAITAAGTLEAVQNASELAKGNNYSNGGANQDAGGSVSLVLRLTRPIDMNLGGTQYHLTTIAVALGPNITEDEKNSLIGRKADVKGPLDENFATNWCPAGIKAMEIHVE